MWVIKNKQTKNTLQDSNLEVPGWNPWPEQLVVNLTGENETKPMQQPTMGEAIGCGVMNELSSEKKYQKAWARPRL